MRTVFYQLKQLMSKTSTIKVVTIANTFAKLPFLGLIVFAIFYAWRADEFTLLKGTVLLIMLIIDDFPWVAITLAVIEIFSGLLLRIRVNGVSARDLEKNRRISRRILKLSEKLEKLEKRRKT